MNMQFRKVWGRLPIALVAAGLLWVTGSAYATEQAQQHRETRNTWQDSRETKVDCRAADQKSNPECRQQARDIKY